MKYRGIIVKENNVRHELTYRNLDIEVRFYLSVDDGSYVTPHWHNSLELVYMIEGSMEIKIENKNILLNADEFMVVNSKVIHSILSKKNKALVLQFPNEMLEKYITDNHLLYFKVDMKPLRAVEVTKLERIKKIFKDMYMIYDIKPDAYLLKFNSLLYDLLFTLVHSYSIKLTEKDITKNKTVNKLKSIMLYLDKEHGRQIEIQEIAEKFGYHPDSLSRLFKKHLGMTIIEYLYEIRMDYVIKDLQQSDLFVYEIFERHGCTNYKISMKKFKDRFGCTPKEMKKKISQSE